MVAVPFGVVTLIVGDCMLAGYELPPSIGTAAQSQYGKRHDNAADAYR